MVKLWFRRRSRWSIRTLLFCILAAAISLSIGARPVIRAYRIQGLVQQVEQLSGKVYFPKDQGVCGFPKTPSYRPTLFSDEEPYYIDLADTATCDSDLNDLVKRINHFPNFNMLNIHGTDVTSAGLRQAFGKQALGKQVFDRQYGLCIEWGKFSEAFPETPARQ